LKSAVKNNGWHIAVILGFIFISTVPSLAQIRNGGEPSYQAAPPGAVGLSPEDIVNLPSTRWLIAGAAPNSNAGDRAGIAIIDSTDPSITRALYPAPSNEQNFDRTLFPDCPGPPSSGLGPHGINIERLADGSYNLLVVNHRGRESIEIFHLDQSESIPRATWRGCVILPGSASGNSVAPLPNGQGYVVTNFLQKDDPNYLQSMENGTSTGNVLKWTPAGGWAPIVPQRFSGANGLEVTPDGKWFFVSEWSDYKIWKFALRGGDPPQTIHLDFLPDNLRLTDRGTILIAGQDADPVNVMTCRSRHVPCQSGYTVLEMDPDTMVTHTLLHGGDINFGGATGAAMTGTSLWVSSYYAPQVARFAPK